MIEVEGSEGFTEMESTGGDLLSNHLYVRDVMVGVNFFSSRRRHTRYWRDWSSDVCSSDLGELVWKTPALPVVGGDELYGIQPSPSAAVVVQDGRVHLNVTSDGMIDGLPPVDRSEERRVGKECRSRRSPYH